MADNPYYCNARVPCTGAFIDDLCKFPPKWKLVFSWGTKYYCTMHKNKYAKGAEKISAHVAPKLPTA